MGIVSSFDVNYFLNVKDPVLESYHYNEIFEVIMIPTAHIDRFFIDIEFIKILRKLWISKGKLCWTWHLQVSAFSWFFCVVATYKIKTINNVFHFLRSHKSSFCTWNIKILKIKTTRLKILYEIRIGSNVISNDNQLYHKMHEILIFNYKTNMHFKCVKTNIDDLRYNEANA